jgi:tRNA-Thr(GGU) m(6)t(6)A37 methyltransferase TsaA
MTAVEKIELKAIGTVRSEIKEPTRERQPEIISEIVIGEELTEALDDIDQFSYIMVLWWIHKSRRPSPMKVHPRRDPQHKPMGVFSTRSPDRPNPIGLSTVKLVERRGNVLKVKGLDAIDGTPVLDIKPYIPGYDSVDDAKVPLWMLKE